MARKSQFGMTSSLVPRVGVGVFVLRRDGRFVIGRRKGSHGQGMVQLPGGHLEFKESFEECARREVLEETNLELESVSFATATNDVFESENLHYITVFMCGRTKDANPEPKLMEPHKCEGWEFVSWDELAAIPRDQLFRPLQNLFKTRPGFSPSFHVAQTEKPAP